MIKSQKIDEKYDIWCLGLILYELIHNSFPFKSIAIEQKISEILSSKIIYKQSISNNLKDLFTKLLERDPLKRISATEIFYHEWIQTNIRDIDITFLLHPKFQKQKNIENFIKLSNFSNLSQTLNNPNIRSSTFFNNNTLNEIILSQNKNLQKSSINLFSKNISGYNSNKNDSPNYIHIFHDDYQEINKIRTKSTRTELNQDRFSTKNKTSRIFSKLNEPYKYDLSILDTISTNENEQIKERYSRGSQEEPRFSTVVNLDKKNSYNVSYKSYTPFKDLSIISSESKKTNKNYKKEYFNINKKQGFF